MIDLIYLAAAAMVVALLLAAPIHVLIALAGAGVDGRYVRRDPSWSYYAALVAWIVAWLLAAYARGLPPG